MNQTIKKLAIATSTLLLLTSCGKNPVEARKELAQLDIPFEEETCFEYATKQDKAVTDLFLATDIDSGCLVKGAVQAKDLELAREALKREFAPDNKYALSALYQAIANEQTDIARSLIVKGVQTPEAFAFAAEQGQIDIVKLLLKQGIEPKYGIVGASSNGNLKLAKLLLDKGADPNYDPANKSSKNSAALCQASKSGHQEIVKLLLSKKANSNSSYGSFYGLLYGSFSCLHLALANNHAEIAQMLREAGATNPSLTGQWKINYDVNRTLDSAGRISEVDASRTRYVNLTQNESVITGELTAADRGSCTDAIINGKIIDNNVNWTLKHRGSCCPNGKSSYKGKVDYSSPTIAITGKMQPLANPPENCYLWMADFEASKVE